MKKFPLRDGFAVRALYSLPKGRFFTFLLIIPIKKDVSFLISCQNILLLQNRLEIYKCLDIVLGLQLMEGIWRVRVPCGAQLV